MDCITGVLGTFKNMKIKRFNPQLVKEYGFSYVKMIFIIIIIIK